ncbi:MAG: plastocyanin/azurin family copper-binding protein [Actinomycetota bacterium]|nr:plastocyanin/azurin family copper-binding protein [Actinomycetota bacterium]
MRRSFALVAAVVLIAAACTTSPSDAPHEDETATTSPTTTTSTTTTTAAPTTTITVDDHADDDAVDDDHVDSVQTGEADRTVEVVMTEFAFDVDPVDVAAGEAIEFVVTNAGVVPHEFRLSNGHRIEEHLASGHDDHDDSDAQSDDDGHHEGGDIVLLLDAGDTSSIVVTFPEDTSIFTEVACLLPGHYEAGMFADVRYTA